MRDKVIDLIKSFRTLIKKKRGFLLGILIGIILILPFTIHSYQVLDTDIVFTNDKIAYNDMYLLNFGELGNASENDGMLVCWFNITTADYVVIVISFNEHTEIHGIGVLYHRDEIIKLENILDPIKSVEYVLNINDIGLYSCSVFFITGDHCWVNIGVYCIS